MAQVHTPGRTTSIPAAVRQAITASEHIPGLDDLAEPHECASIDEVTPAAYGAWRADVDGRHVTLLDELQIVIGSAPSQSLGIATMRLLADRAPRRRGSTFASLAAHYDAVHVVGRRRGSSRHQLPNVTSAAHGIDSGPPRSRDLR